MNNSAKVGLAVAGGYLLGRTRKMKLALALGLLVAGRKLPSNPTELAQQGLKALGQNEQFADLSHQVTGSLADAGKVAASKSAERMLTKVSDRLRDGIEPDTDDDQAADGADDQQESSEPEKAESKTDEDDNDDSTTATDGETEKHDRSPRKKTGSGSSSRSRKQG